MNNTPYHVLPKNKNEKRKNYLEWDEYFMAVTLLEVRKAASTHVTDAAIILNRRQIIISMASNGLPEESNIVNKPHYKHAEYKAVQKIQQGDVMYTTSFPCEECAKSIINVGIKEIIYFKINTINDEAEQVLKDSGVVYRRFFSNKGKIKIDFKQYCGNEPLNTS